MNYIEGFQVTTQLPTEQHRALQHSFQRLCQSYGLDPLRIETYQKILFEAHQQPRRYYHNLSHLHNMLALLQQQTLDEAHKHLLELAIWYHDSIYDAASKNNEAQSAKLAQAHWKQHLPTPQLESLKKLIQATAKHQLLDYTVAEQLFLDLDLSILAAPPAVYRAYSQAIAQEYQAVYPRLLYKMGRKKVLKNFLARPRIYFSNPFYESYEAAARANLAAEQKELA